MKSLEQRTLFYWHSEGISEETFQSKSNGLYVNSANLIDFLVHCGSSSRRCKVAGPLVNKKQNVVLPMGNNTSAIRCPLDLRTRLTTITTLPAFLVTLLRGPVSDSLRDSEICVSVGLSGTGTLVGLIRTLVFRRQHAFIVRGNRIKTVSDSSRTSASKFFAITRIKFYTRAMKKLVTTNRAEIWFQGAAHYEALASTMRRESAHRLFLLNAVLREMPLLEVTGKKYDLVFVGRITVEKGLLETMEALHSLSKSKLPLSLCIIGSGPDESIIRNKISEYGLDDQITWKGFISDSTSIANLLSSSKIFILPSYTEGLPRSLLEAMWIGLPCITTPVGGIPYHFSDEESAFFIKPKDSLDLENTIRKVIELQKSESLQAVLDKAKSIALECTFNNKSKTFLEAACQQNQNAR